MSNWYDELELENCEQNELLVTNFQKVKRNIYEKAIEMYGSNNLYIRDKAYWRDGRLDDRMNALMVNYREELGKFWKIFESLNKSR